jgi:hypothetical protein
MSLHSGNYGGFSLRLCANIEQNENPTQRGKPSTPTPCLLHDRSRFCSYPPAYPDETQRRCITYIKSPSPCALWMRRKSWVRPRRELRVQPGIGNPNVRTHSNNDYSFAFSRDGLPSLFSNFDFIPSCSGNCGGLSRLDCSKMEQNENPPQSGNVPRDTSSSDVLLSNSCLWNPSRLAEDPANA